MKITIISLFNIIETHGLSNVVRAHIKYLRENGHEIQLVQPSIPKIFRNRKISEMDFINRKIEVDDLVEVMPISAAGDFTNPLPLVSLIRTLNYKPDIIHAHEVSCQMIAFLLMARLFGIKYIVTSHQSYRGYLKISIKWFKVIIIPFLLFWVGFFYNMADQVIALSESHKRDLIKIGVKENKIVILNNGVSDDCEGCIKDISENQEIKLVSIGNWEQRKNQNFLIEAMQFLPNNYHLKLIGHVHDSNYFFSAIKRIQELNLFERVQIMGKIPYDRIVGSLNNSNIFVFSSKIEAQSLVILEAVSTSLPCVILNPIEGDPIIEDNVNGYLLNASSTPKEFAEKIILASNPQNYSRFSKNNFEKTQSLKYSNILPGLIEIYNRLI